MKRTIEPFAAGAASIIALLVLYAASSGNIQWTQLASASRHGSTGTAGQSFTGSSATNDAAKFNSTGDLVTVGGPVGAVLLEEHTASSSATLAFPSCITASFDRYIIDAVNLVPASSGTTLGLQMGTGGGPTYDTGSNYNSANFGGNEIGGATTGGSSSATSIALNGPQATTTSWVFDSTVQIYAPAGGNFTFVNFVSSWLSSGDGHFYSISGSGTYKQTTAVTAVRVLYSSGNIASGTVRCYGLNK